MKWTSWLSWKNAPFERQLLITITFGIIVLALLSTASITHLTSEELRSNLIEQGKKAAETLAKQSRFALLSESVENAEEPAAATLALPGVEGVAIFDANNVPLINLGHKIIPTYSDDEWPSDALLYRETSLHWYFLSPVISTEIDWDSPFGEDSSEPARVGHVVVITSKEQLKNTIDNIVNTNYLVAVLSTIILSLLLLFITRRVTRPIRRLADLMEQARSGNRNVRADSGGPRDIAQMRSAFNSMMSEIDKRDKALKHALDAAVENARIKGEFATNVSHELRTPMNGVLGTLDLLHEMDLTREQRDYVDISRSSAESLLLLIDEILDFSRMEAGELSLDDQEFLLTELLDDVVGILGGQAQRKGLELGYVVDSDVPLGLWGASRRIRQILINLVGNSIKFTDTGNICIKTSVADSECVDNKFCLRIEVSDTGIGIPEEMHDRVFEAFAQVDGSMTRRYGGSGLGLAICKEIVALMGGDIGVSSDRNQGSTFWLEVPLKTVNARSEKYAQERSSAKGLRVLLVDGSLLYCTAITALFDRWGIFYEVVEDINHVPVSMDTASLKGRPFDIVMVDERSGRSNLDSTLKEINLHDSRQPVSVVLLLEQGGRAVESAIKQRKVRVVTKPIRESMLYDAISRPIKLIEESDTRGLSRQLHKSIPSFKEAPVLVVEDNSVNQEVAVGELIKLGCYADVASSGKEALDLIDRTRYALILMDVQMPEMDGYETTRAIRQSGSYWSSVPIIAMTAHTNPEEIKACIQAGMNDHLGKPLRLTKLQGMLAKWLTPEKDTSITPPPSVTIDEDIFTELGASMGDGMMKLIRMFHEDTAAQLKEIVLSIDNHNQHRIAQLSHEMKGSARNIGAIRLAEVAGRLETDAQNAPEPKLREMTDELQLTLIDSLKELDNLASNLPVPDQREPQHPAHVLVADDDRKARYQLSRVFSSHGFRVTEVENGAEAVAACRDYSPDIVILDAGMPILDGFEACAEIHNMPGPQSIPVLMITALDDDDAVTAALEAGAEDYLPKPVKIPVLLNRVNHLIERRRAQQHAEELSFLDVLTGLPNRSRLLERLGRLIGRTRSNEERTVLMSLDLDRFKLVNDTLGNEAGDLLLKQVAERICICVRSADMVARVGGDRFSILIDGINTRENTARIAQTIANAFREPFVIFDREMFVNASIGIAVYPDDADNSNALIQRSEAALAHTKQSIDSYQFYKTGMAQESRYLVTLETKLRRAIEREELVLYYQVQTDLKSGKYVGAEALVRWEQPGGRLVPPNDFIPLAEDTGLIEPLGEWVINEACRQVKTWQSMGLPNLRVAVNVSPRQLERKGLARSIGEYINKNHIKAEQLEVEITETSIMRRPELAVRVLNELKEQGVSIALDDFGTGQTSLSHLKRLPIDYLKIDRSFVRDIATDPEDAAIVEAVIAMSRALGIEVIAEGVETEVQMAFLKEHRCDMIQGYLISKPVPPSEFEKLFPEYTKSNAQSQLTTVQNKFSGKDRTGR